MYYEEGRGIFIVLLRRRTFLSFQLPPRIARTLIGDQTLSVYFTYFIAQRVTKLSNEYTLFDPIMLHNHNIKMCIKTFLLLAVSRVLYWLQLERVQPIQYATRPRCNDRFI